MRTAQKRAYDRAYYLRNREKIIARSQACHEANRARTNARQREYYARRGKWLRQIPGWTKELYHQRLREQRGRCGICNVKMVKPVRDHDHKTNKARLLLCDQCNRLLGVAKDNPNILLNAIVYLKTTKTT